MIEYIDMSNFGSFTNFVWSDHLRDSNDKVVKFKKLNIIYGRNYSGKTTLSRIFHSLQTGALPAKYEAPAFKVSTGISIITPTEIPTADHHIRVYNRDFVDDHLSFLRDSQGKITPFAIIGSENKAIENAIMEKETELGSVEGKTGLRHKFAIKCDEFMEQQRACEKAESALKVRLTNKATQSSTGIKHNPIYRDANYNTPKIEKDIETIRSESLGVLSLKERKDREGLLSETSLPDIEIKLDFIPAISSLYETANRLLSMRIKPTQPIQELLDDAVLQAWVKEGVTQHRDQRKKCGFCGQTLPADLWKKLDEHFSKESDDLEEAIQKHIEATEKHRLMVKSIRSVDTNDLYATLRDPFSEEKKALDDEIIKYDMMLGLIINDLSARKTDIFTPKQIPELQDNSDVLLAKIVAINAIIVQNNKKTESLAEDQKEARNELRLSEVAEFIQYIDLDGEEKKVADLKTKTHQLKTEADRLQAEILSLEKKIDDLQTQLKDEKKGAEKVNEYLNHYFAHESLRLKAVEDTETSAYKFQILRGDKPAYDLSDGECSLVSFCYFVAKLEDTDSRDKKLVIYIDDPVSSLDSNHIFFVYSLIENLMGTSKNHFFSLWIP